jgi:hypothetical protein
MCETPGMLLLFFRRLGLRGAVAPSGAAIMLQKQGVAASITGCGNKHAALKSEISRIYE